MPGAWCMMHEASIPSSTSLSSSATTATSSSSNEQLITKEDGTEKWNGMVEKKSKYEYDEVASKVLKYTKRKLDQQKDKKRKLSIKKRKEKRMKPIGSIVSFRSISNK